MCPASCCSTRHTSHVACHTSHLTPHTSHLTPHSSHLTPHTSHLTPHTSHLTPHSSLLTPHSSHLTPHTSHLTPHTSHLTPQVQARLGAVVLSILLRSCTIESMVPAALGNGAGLPEDASSSAAAKRKPIPAFYHAYLHSKMKRIGVIKATDAVYHHIEMAGEHVETMHPRHQPMVAKPLPWTSAEQVTAQR